MSSEIQRAICFSADWLELPKFVFSYMTSSSGIRYLGTLKEKNIPFCVKDCYFKFAAVLDNALQLLTYCTFFLTKIVFSNVLFIFKVINTYFHLSEIAIL